MKKPVFTGAGVAIITPFKSTGEVNYEEFGRIIDYQIAHHTDAIIVCGTTGEASALHDKEHREVLSWCCEYVNHRVPVIAGTGSNDTAYAIELTKFAAECGADAGLSVTPYYNKTTQRGLIAHYTAIADCCDLPIVLYNVPSRTGVSFTADTLYELSKHPNINGLKAASGNFSLLAETMAKCGDNLNVWSGNDDQIVPMMSLGAKGVISVLSNVAPQETHDLTQLCLENRYPEAAQMQFKYHSLIDALFCEVNPIPVKKAMELLHVFELDDKADFLASNLPYGDQRKLEIARALATEPKLLLLDEPAAGMNPNETVELMNTIRFVRDNFDMTVLLIEHDMTLVSGICEKLSVLNFGQLLCQGNTSDVLNNPEVITAYLGE